MAKQKKKSSLLSRRVQWNAKITDSKPSPKTLKPLRARQLIRRFHVLLKYKSSILDRINKLIKWDGEKDGDIKDNYMKYLNRKENLKEIYDFEWKKKWKELKINKTPESVIDHKNNDVIPSDSNIEDLIKILGRIDSEIEKRGGLKTYQTASTLGQDAKRGGDSSKILVKWLDEIKWNGKDLTALEIGCLSSKNEISMCKIFKKIERIDLHSQEPGIIEEQDFLKRPKPKSDLEKFDLISCSLVVNFVPTPNQRGEMLCHICEFLKEPCGNMNSLLFFVIPLPCIENSRYCDLNTINFIFKKLGFETIKHHQTNKLAYWLLKWKGRAKVDMKFTIKKKELRIGSNRNNFSIVIE
jgi:25S rRNA (adenine2142-N1)-methyltransferase